MKARTKGFTLIELMVVMSIISTLSSVVLSGTIAARNKAKDAVYIENLTTMGRALDAYALDHNEQYPVSGHGVWYTSDGYIHDSNQPDPGLSPLDRVNWLPGLAPYMAAMPQTPVSTVQMQTLNNIVPPDGSCGSYTPTYFYRSAGFGYKLVLACPEGGSSGSKFDDNNRPGNAFSICKDAYYGQPGFAAQGNDDHACEWF